jgi:hypothetical protein
MFILMIKIMKSLGGLLPLLGALQLMKFTFNDQLAAYGLRIPMWVTEDAVVVFTSAFLMALTTLMFFMPPRRARAGRFAGGWRDSAVRRQTARLPESPSSHLRAS